VVFAEVDLSSTVLSCILPFESVAYEQDIAMTDDVAQGLRVIGDEKQLKQLTVILLDNACKYAGKKGAVEVKLATRPDHPERVLLRVKNTGEIIPQEEQEHIFQRFYRSDESRVRTTGGYGLGLAIAKTIVDQHHGKIKVSSDVHEGTVFTVELSMVMEK
jgi:signal transduction histidine kinase